MEFCKEEFKKEVTDNLKVLFRRSIEDASQVQLFQAVALCRAQLFRVLHVTLRAVAFRQEVHSPLLGFLFGELLCRHTYRKQQQYD